MDDVTGAFSLDDALAGPSIADAASAGQPVASLQTLATYLSSGYNGANLRWGSSTITYNVSALTAAEANLARAAFASWSRVCNLAFVETTGTGNIAFTDTGTGATTGWSYSGTTLTSATVNISTAWMNSYYTTTSASSTLPYFNYAFQTYVHEIGHALGLGHQGPYNSTATYGTSNIYANDSWQFSVMSYMGQNSYNYGGAGCSYMWIAGPMQADIMAMQMKYGALTTVPVRHYGYAADSAIVNFDTGGRSFCMYAPDGWTQLDGRGYGSGQTVDMRAGAFSSMRGYINNVSTYVDTRVRDYWCGSGGDTVFLSSGGVNVYGGAGADTFYDYGSGGGINTIDGGGGSDTVYVNYAYGAGYTATGTAADFTMSGAFGTDVFKNIEYVHFSNGVTLGVATVINSSGVPKPIHANNLAYGSLATGPYNTIDILNFVAGYADLSAAFGTNQQAAQAWFDARQPIERRASIFDGLDYIASHYDLITAFKGINDMRSLADAGASHFITNGRGEGRSTTFNGLDYIASYSDLIRAFGADNDAGANHFIHSGANEGRVTSFDGLEYIASYRDLISAFGANEQLGDVHYIRNGFNEGRKTTFNGLSYIASSPDLMTAFGADRDAGASHYIQMGVAEMRKTTFDVAGYVAAHPSLAGKYNSDDQFLTAYITTYKTTGQYLT